MYQIRGINIEGSIFASFSFGLYKKLRPIPIIRILPTNDICAITVSVRSGESSDAHAVISP